MPSEFSFQPRSPRYGPSLLSGLLDTNTAHLGHFLAILGRFSDILWSYRARMGSSSRGNQGPRGVQQSFAFVRPFRLGFGAALGQKRPFLGAQNAQFWEGTSGFGAPAPGRHR